MVRIGKYCHASTKYSTSIPVASNTFRFPAYEKESYTKHGNGQQLLVKGENVGGDVRAMIDVIAYVL